MGRPIAPSAVALLTLTACDEVSGTSEDLGEGVDSGIQDVPVPEEADAHENTEGLWRVPEPSYDDLVSWYEDRLPIGEAHNDLEYCETQELDNSTVWLWWDEAPAGHDGTPWLSVSVHDDDPTGVLTSYSDDDLSDCY